MLAFIAMVVGLGPAAGGASSVPELAHTTIISGSRAGGVRVELPDKTRFGDPLNGVASVKVEGNGDFAGFALVAEDVPKRDGLVFFGGRLPRSAGSRYFTDFGGDWFSVGGGKWFGLDPGIYTLYLLPGSGDTTVTLTFEDLEGTTRLSPVIPTEFQAKVSKPRFGDLPSDNYYAAGETARLEGRGLVGGMTWFETGPHAVTDARVCFWRNAPRDPDGYGPTCGDTFLTEPGNSWNSSEMIHYGAGIDDHFGLLTGSWHPFKTRYERPRWGISHIVTSASVMKGVGSLGFWLTYL